MGYNSTNPRTNAEEIFRSAKVFSENVYVKDPISELFLLHTEVEISKSIS
jgi:hypothetical protein